MSITDQYRDVYAHLVPSSVRLRRGQYFTPDVVCDLMLALSEAASVQRILDPCCGTGAFLMRAQDMRSHTKSLCEDLYGVELDPQAAALSQLQLGAALPQPGAPTVLNGDFLGPLPDGFSNFDLILGNPPYIRQEHLHQQPGLNKDKILTALETEFSAYLEAYPSQKILFQKKADLYLWFFLKATHLLNTNGKLAFITSNSWLNTTTGFALQALLHHHFKILAMVETSAEAWFSDAAIQPIIIILEKKEPLTEPPVHPVALLRLTTPLANLLPDPQEPKTYWQNLLATCKQILQQKPPAAWAGQIRYIPQTLLETASSCPTLNWSLHLRAPQSLLDSLAQPKQPWIPLKSIATVRYPLKTGINAFFYLSPKRLQEFGIEPEFCIPVIKSTRSVHRYDVTPEDAEVYLFSCLLGVETLRQQNKQGALGYIEWGSRQTSPARQKRPKPVLWPDIPSVQGRKAWYQMQPLAAPHLLACRFFDRRFVFPLCQGEILEDQTFYGITLHDANPTAQKLVAALLNSTLSYFLVELYGRNSLGDGVLQYATTDMANFPLPDIKDFSNTQQQQIIEAFEAMRSRPLLPIDAEVQQADRLALDEAILSCLGFQTERSAWIEALLERVSERRQLSKLRRQAHNIP